MTSDKQRIAISERCGIDADCLNDLNAIREDEDRAGLFDRENHKLRVRWINSLRSIVDRRTPKNHIGSPMTTDVDLMTASAAERAEALLKTLNLWNP